MIEWQERVIEERAQLTERIGRLLQFVAGPIFKSLSPQERGLLSRQLTAMRSYEALLSERIALWGRA